MAQKTIKDILVKKDKTFNRISTLLQASCKVLRDLQDYWTVLQNFAIICKVLWDSARNVFFLNWEVVVGSFRIHFTVTMQHTGEGWVESFVRDVRETVAMCMKNPQEKAKGEVSFLFFSLEKDCAFHQKSTSNLKNIIKIAK